MSRSAGYAVTGNELQAMVNERILGLKAAIPQNDYCLTNAQVFNSVYVYSGDSPSGSFIPWVDLSSGGTFSYGPSPNYLANFSNINPVHATGTIVFELNQEGNPYLTAELGGYVNGVPLRLDPANNLDGMFFGGPQLSPEMKTVTPVGSTLYAQANFGLSNIDGSSWGWDAPGIGKLEVYGNGILMSNQTLWKYPYNGSNSQSLSFSFTIQAGVTYLIKAYSLVAYAFDHCYHVNNAYNACGGDGDCGCIQC